MPLLHRYPAFVTRCIKAASRDSHLFAERVEVIERLCPAAPFQIEANAVRLDGLRLVAFQASGHRARLVDEETVGVIVAQHGRLVVEDGRGLTEVRGDAGVFLRPGPRTTTIPGPYVGLGLRVAASRMAAHAALNAEDGWRAGGAPPRPSPHLVRALRRLVSDLDAPRAPPPESAVARGMARRLLDVLVEEFGGALQPSPGPGLLHIRRAEAALRERLPEAVSIVALAGELGISTRSLQLGFRRHRGTTPRDFLATCRLETVRERLCKAQPRETVTNIALECGVMHLGRFAAHYRAHYGEPPSATLARARRRA